MRVLQLIDTFDAGGAERMAINIANALSEVEGVSSFLVATRRSGPLESNIDEKVSYTILNKRKSVDIGFLQRLRRFCADQNIEIIHAHSTSFFYAALVKMMRPKIKLVWHDHYGKSELLSERKVGHLKRMSRYFDAVISVNEILMVWAREELKSKQCFFLKNFVVPTTSNAPFEPLKGKEGFRIVCMANLRPQKDHINLLKAYILVKKRFPEASLHLLGKDFEDQYSEDIRNFIKDHRIKDVWILGSQKNIPALLDMATIGVLSSKSEGLPLALLEYGMQHLPVVVTDVGDCANVIQDNGQLVSPGDPIELAEAMQYYLEDKTKRKSDAALFHKRVVDNFSEHNFVKQLVKIYNSL